jgi:hypothetical protein
MVWTALRMIVMTKTVSFVFFDSRFISLLAGVRIEWCKARARALRWAEEVELLQEEMCRVLQFFDWQANWWEEQGRLQICQTAAHNEGLHAYAAQQAYMPTQLSKPIFDAA